MELLDAQSNRSKGACMLHFQGRALGLFLIGVTALIWVAASFISESLVSTKPDEAHTWHVPPFVLTYLSTSLFTLFLPGVHIKSWLLRRWRDRPSAKYHPVASDVADAGSKSARGQPAQRLDTNELEQEQIEQEAMTAAAWCFGLWFAAQYCFNLSLSLTSVTSNTILSSSSSLFTFAFSMVFLREAYSLGKLASIGACMAGTILVTLSDGSGSEDAAAGRRSEWGDILCLLAAALYAAYTVVLRTRLPDDDEADVALFFGYVGVFCATTFAPVLVFMLWTGMWSAASVPTQAFLLILVQGLLNYLLSDYLWARAVLLLGPSVATLGLSMQIPVAAAVEPIIGNPAWLHSTGTIFLTVVGTVLILGGFVGGTLAAGTTVPGTHRRHSTDGDGGRTPIIPVSAHATITGDEGANDSPAHELPPIGDQALHGLNALEGRCVYDSLELGGPRQAPPPGSTDAHRAVEHL